MRDKVVWLYNHTVGDAANGMAAKSVAASLAKTRTNPFDALGPGGVKMCRFELRNIPFGLAKRAVLRLKTARFVMC